MLPVEFTLHVRLLSVLAPLNGAVSLRCAIHGVRNNGYFPAPYVVRREC